MAASSSFKETFQSFLPFRFNLNLAKTLLLLTPLLFTFVKRSGMANVTSHTCGLHSIAYVTVPNNTVAKKIAHGLVTNKLAACVNIIPQITSIYEWKGKIEEDSELLLMIKTRTSLVDKLTDFVRQNHPYEVCEVISTPMIQTVTSLLHYHLCKVTFSYSFDDPNITQIQNGNEPYLKWISDVLPEKA